MMCSSGISVFGSHKCRMHYRLNIISLICNKAEVSLMKMYNAWRITPPYMLKAIFLGRRNVSMSLRDYPT